MARHSAPGGDSLPAQAGNGGKFLTTDGSAASWGTPAAGGTDLFDTAKWTTIIFPHEAFTLTIAGSGTQTQDNSGHTIQSGTTANSIARFALTWGGGGGITGFNKSMSFRFVGRAAQNLSTGKTFIYPFAETADPNAATKYAGIRIEGAIVRAVSKDGTTEQMTDITTAYGALTGTKIIDIVFTQGVDVVFKINGVVAVTHATNIPPNTDTTSTVFGGFRVENGATADSQQLDAFTYVFQRNI